MNGSAKAQVLAALRVAGYHEDKKAFTRLYVEKKIGMYDALYQYEAGKRMKAQGIQCTCKECVQ